MSKIVEILDSYSKFNPHDKQALDIYFGGLDTDGLTLRHQSGARGGGYYVQAGAVEISFENGIRLFNPDSGEQSIWLDPDGDALFGWDTTDPAKTALSIFSNDQTYNGNEYGKGDLLIGDDNTDKANILWDYSEGKLYFRSGTTVSVTIGDGGLIAEWGTIGGWEITASQIKKGAIVLDSANEKITVDTDKVVLSSFGISAVAGAIGGWSLGANTFSGGGIVLNSTNGIITVGASEPTIILDGGNKSVHSSNYSADASGFLLDAVDGNAFFNNITARGTFKASVFAVEEITAVGGNILVSKDAFEIWEDVTTPGTLTSFTLKVKKPSDGIDRLDTGDIFRVKAWNGTEIVDVWGTVTFYSNSTTHWTCLVDLESGTSMDIQKGMGLVNYGPANAGVLELQAGEQSTRLRIATHAGAPWSAMTNMVVLGNMRNTYDTGSNDRYGIGIGDFSSGNYLSYNAKVADEFILKAGAGVVQIDANGITLNDTAGEQSKIKWDFDDSGTPRALGTVFADYSGTGDTAVTWVRAEREATGSPWDYPKVILHAWDKAASIDSRLTLWTDHDVTGNGILWITSARVNIENSLAVGVYDVTLNDGDVRATGDIFTDIYQSFSPTITGFSGTPTATMYYKTVGERVFIDVFITGTSNTTAYWTFTIPHANVAHAVYPLCRVMNAGAYPVDPGYLHVQASSNVVRVYRNLASSTWSASGTKRVFATFTYETT